MMSCGDNRTTGPAGHRRNGVRPGPHHVPDSLQGEPYRSLSLSMLVAWWVYLQDSPVSAREVSDAFHISPRRAGDLLLYLMHNVSRVQCSRAWLTVPGGGRHRVWTVQRIGDLPPRKPEVAAPCKPKPVKKKAPPARRRALPQSLRDLRSWMVSRRTGEAVPASYAGNSHHAGQERT
ncbi:CaiF/GrlA family transcriptional regulator [Salmonella enterica]|uniref:CaiF/GrlA family transcriptional regulator n=1 Tax=Salmonella enterica TaxID=28901 RepID=A0A5U6SY10_SALER|nr:CaiF/GrlA family transcriptional regulator [Salmonella enterica]